MNTSIMKSVSRIAACLCLVGAATGALADAPVPGHVIGRHIFGLARDVNADPLIQGDRTLIFDASQFDVALVSDRNSFVVSGFGDVLGGLYLSRYDAGSKRYLDTDSFSLAGVNGLSSPRGGVATPWGTVLLAESRRVDAADPAEFVGAVEPFFKGKADRINPYNYGWLAEAVLLDDQGNSKLIKHYSVGRVSASELFMMPDGRTLYLFDRDNAGQLYLYISKYANSYSDGTLYGIRIDGGQIAYVELGEASALTMKMRTQTLRFDSLFERAPIQGGVCPAGFAHAPSVYGDECLKLNESNREYAGLLEPIRTLAVLSGDKPTQKLLAVNFDAKQNRLVLTPEGGSGAPYGLAPDKDMGSDYVIQGERQ